MDRRRPKAAENQIALEQREIGRTEACAARDAAAETKRQKIVARERLREIIHIEVNNKKLYKENKRISLAASRSMLVLKRMIKPRLAFKSLKKSRVVLATRGGNQTNGN